MVLRRGETQIQKMDFRVKIVTDLENCLINGKLEDAVAMIQNKDYENEVKIGCGELIAVVSKHLTDDNYRNKTDVFGACEKILTEIAARATKEDVLFELLELLEAVKNDELFISILKAVQVVLSRTNHKTSQAVGWVLDAVGLYLRGITLPADSVEKIGPEEENLLENKPEIQRLLSLYMILFQFLEPVQISLNAAQSSPKDFRHTCFNSRNIMSTFLLQMLGGPFAYLKFSCDGKAPSYARQCAEKILEFFRKSFPNPFQLLEAVEERTLFRIKDPNDGPSNIFLQEERVSLVSIAMLFYLMTAEGVKVENLPRIYRPEYLVDGIMRLVMVFLRHSEANLQYKGILLGQAVLRDLPEPLEFSTFDSLTLWSILERLEAVVVFSVVERNRKEGIDFFGNLVKSLDRAGQLLVLEHLFNSVENDGMKAFVVMRYKDLLVKSAPEVPMSFEETMRSHVCVLKDAEKTDLMDSKDSILAALNTLLFLAIRNNAREGSFWTLMESLESQFLEPLRRGIELSRAHYVQEQKRVVEGPDVIDDEPPLEILNELPDDSSKVFTKARCLDIISFALNTFDIMESLLARINECKPRVKN